MTTIVRAAAFVGCVLVLAGEARAQFVSGTVTGTIKIKDTRADPYSASISGTPAWASRATAGETVPTGARQTGKFVNTTLNPLPAPLSIAAPRALVYVCIGLNGQFCTLHYWARASETGVYTVPWSGTGTVNRITVTSHPEWPDWSSSTPSQTRPPHVFRITTSSGTILEYGTTVISSGILTGTRIMNHEIVPSEAGNAYLTAAETYLMHGVQVQPPNLSIIADMKGVLISINESPSGLTVGGGVAPTDSFVALVPGTATANPFSIAHELGHILAWRSFNVATALIGLAEYNCDNMLIPAWSEISNECEKGAWHDGIAHMHAAMWMWVRTTPNPRIPRGFNSSVGTSIETPGTECGTTVPGHRRVICNARAMWDLVDRPTADDDSINNRDLGSVVHVYRSYASNCAPGFDNGCVGEPGVNDMNWKDYRRNHRV
jgi:hypothetical protein